MQTPTTNLLSLRTKSLPHFAEGNVINYESGMRIEYVQDGGIPYFDISKGESFMMIYPGSGAKKTAAIAVISECIRDIEQALDTNNQSIVFNMQQAVIKTIEQHHANSARKAQLLISQNFS